MRGVKLYPTFREFPNSLNLKSDLVASDFVIEFTRRVYGLSSIDSDFDDKVFIICMVRDGSDIIVELLLKCNGYECLFSRHH